jgi:hypothetical protein
MEEINVIRKSKCYGTTTDPHERLEKLNAKLKTCMAYIKSDEFKKDFQM